MRHQAYQVEPDCTVLGVEWIHLYTQQKEMDSGWNPGAFLMIYVNKR